VITVGARRRGNTGAVMPAGRALVRATAGACVAGLVFISGGCTTHPPEAAKGPATLTPGHIPTGECGPNRFTRCVPGLADFSEELFDDILVEAPKSPFATWPRSTTAPESSPADCQILPRLGARTGPELAVSYQPATDAHGVRRDPRFAAKDTEWVEVRLMATDAEADPTRAMTDWARRCPIWAVAPTRGDGRIETWLLGESADALARYQSGDVAGQWRRVTQMAAAVLPNGVIAQAWFSTDDPSATSRRDTLTQLIDAVGRHRPRSALPPRLADWSPGQISTLLPPLAAGVIVDARSGQDADPPWNGCLNTDYPPEPRRDSVAEWRDTDPSRWGQPTVTIGRAHPGIDYLADLRREIATCAAHSTDKPELCADREDRRYLTTDAALADGEDTVRFTHRWMRVEKVQAYDRCDEGIEIYRVTQVRGFLVVSTTHSGGPKAAPGPSPELPLQTLDELQAATVHQLKAA
jgi:hypothetical protein